jgi:hypothetical protein
MGHWGFPLTSLDLRHLIKAYLDGLGKTVERLELKPNFYLFL